MQPASYNHMIITRGNSCLRLRKLHRLNQNDCTDHHHQLELAKIGNPLPNPPVVQGVIPAVNLQRDDRKA